ncbi:MAG: TMEM175 family protein [Alphaproteobacteria bacterium]|nr:TMEM175 family protein [Alphaproteobacteria bacterium]
MNTTRLEAFSDGVIAIIITIMVLELKVPHGESFAELQPLVPTMLSYVLSFVYVGMYWNNHHHLLRAADKINGMILWTNLHLLFWLSLIPFTTGWMGENHFAPLPVALYGFVLFMAAVAYNILTVSLLHLHNRSAMITKALEKNYKGIISAIIYAGAMLLSFVYPWISVILYAAVAVMWIIPDRKIEEQVEKHPE